MRLKSERLLRQAFGVQHAPKIEIRQKFGAAQALIATWTGAAEALKLPFPENLFAFAKVLATGFKAVEAIKGVNVNGGGATGAPGASAATPQAEESGSALQFVNVNVRGRIFDRQTINELISGINEAVGDDIRIRTT